MHSEPLVLHLDKKYPIDPIRLRQGENSLTEIKAKIYSESVPYDLTDCEVTLRYTCPDKSTGLDKVTITDATAGEVTYTLTNRLTSAPGDIRAAYFAITQKDKLVTTQNLGFLILKDVDLNADEAAEYQSYIDELLVQLNELMDECDEAIKRLDGAVKQAKEDIDQYVEESTEKVDKKLEEINDLTTGENLIHGSKDFVIASTSSWNNYKDGFYQGLGDWTYTKDDEGFTVAESTRTSVTDSFLQSSFFKAKQNDTFTVSVDFMSNDIDAIPESAKLLQVYFFNEAISAVQNFSFTKQDLIKEYGSLQSNTWYQMVFVVTATNASCSTGVVRLYASNVGNYKFRKSMVEHDDINHPIWAANPNDYDLSEFIRFKTITENADLNSLTKPGWYQCRSDAIAKTVDHQPIEKSTAVKFNVHVEPLSSQDNEVYCKQTYFSCNNNLTYERTIHDSVFPSWVSIFNSEIVMPINNGGTGGDTLVSAQNNLRINRLNSMIFNGTAGDNRPRTDDTIDFWKSTNMGLYYGFNFLGNYKNQWGELWHLKASSTETTGQAAISQLFIVAPQNATSNDFKLGFRANINSKTTGPMARFDFVLSEDKPHAYNSGLYSGNPVLDKFKEEIGSTHLATWLQARVKAGNFEGLNIGDFVDIVCDSVAMRYRIGAIDPYYGCGDQQKGHHIVMVPDRPWNLSEAKDGEFAINTNYLYWNKTADNNGIQSQPYPYLASNLHKWEIEKMLPRFPKEWQDAMLNQRLMLEIRYDATSKLLKSSDCAWVDVGKIWSPSEIEVYGQCAWGTPGFTAGIDCQFPIFSQTKNREKSRISWWLRNVRNDSSTHVCYVNGYGSAGNVVTNNIYVCPLPCFLIG